MSDQDENVSEAEVQEQTADQERPEDRAAEDQEPESKANAEAAKYRTRLREAEAQRDALAGNVDALRRQIVESLVTDKGRLGNPATLWETGTTLEELLTSDGTVDPQKVLDKCEDVAQRLRIARAPKGPYVPKEGNVTSGRVRGDWEGAFKPR